MGREKFFHQMIWFRTRGSPPRRRGKVLCGHAGHVHHRITPAWAGKSAWRFVRIAPCWDHPRMGGEKNRKESQTSREIGSPPRGRGKGRLLAARLHNLRITPAWAGKRKQACFLFRHSRDHPRIGGEKCPLVSDVIFGWGSPPRGRGKVGHNQIAGAAHGITPAWTGKRVCFPASVPPVQDHPRVGGEK